MLLSSVRVYYFLVVAYIVSVGSNWSEWTDVDPKTHLAEVVSLCRLLDAQRCIIVMGISNMSSFVCLHSPIML